ncbi:3'(2'),5'-bisphosphate nucleotidase CysQ [Pseudochelatococcus sp. G4_1912]|uniref:3'(2'),5'-bisphosphate nucleotidase CysQ n=1 Tax=Pseudochelatococcus sp. G4_1912 TaxID=3114288 RepID=UPI0039C6F1DB
MPRASVTLTDHDLAPIRALVEEAGHIALSFFKDGARTHAAVHFKGDHSPVTEADIAVDKFLRDRLTSLIPEAGWLSEESVDDLSRLNQSLTWIVDPIDGTRAFSEGGRDWAISVALVYEGAPIAGIIWAPALAMHYEATLGTAARRNGQPITVSHQSSLEGARVAGPNGMLKALRHQGHAIIPMPREPSLALRIVRVADATLDAGLATGNAHDWDIAAADLIVREAGGNLSTVSGTPLRYNTRTPVHGCLISANNVLAPQLQTVLTEHEAAP